MGDRKLHGNQPDEVILSLTRRSLTYHRNSDTDRQVLFVLCKLLLASEKSLLHRRRYHPFLLQAWESSDLLTYMCWVVIGMVVILSFLLL